MDRGRACNGVPDADVFVAAPGMDRASQFLMNHATKGEYETRDQILKLLSDEEIARVSAAEGEARLVDGDEYIDLGAPHNGVRRVHGAMQQTMGKVLPRSAVSPKTWAQIAERFGTRFAAKTAG